MVVVMLVFVVTLVAGSVSVSGHRRREIGASPRWSLLLLVLL